MARVVREKSKVLSGSIGINTTGGADVSNSLNQIASAANNASQMMFTRANEIAQEEGIQAGKDLTIDQITTLDEDTGKPVALSIPKTWGVTRTNAFRELVDKRFYASIENEIRLKSKEYSQKYKQGGNYLANYRASMENYLVQMHKNSEGAYANFIKEVGSNTIAATEPNILSYLESKHIAQNNAFYKVEKQRLLNMFVTADAPTKNQIMLQLQQLTKLQIDSGQLPKNALDADNFAMRRISTMQWASSKIDEMNKDQIASFQELLKAPHRVEKLDELGFNEEQKKYWNDNKQFLDIADLNSLFTYGNHNRAEIDRLETENLNDIVDDISKNAPDISETVLKSINDLKLDDFDIDNLDALASFTYGDTLEKYPNLNIDDPRIAKFNNEQIQFIKSKILERYTAPIYGSLSNDDEQAFDRIGGFDLVKNKSFVTNYKNLSKDDQIAYDYIVENTDGGKEILDTLHNLYKEGVDANSIITQFMSSTQFWTKPLTETQISKEKLKQQVISPDNGIALDTDSKEIQEISSEHINEAWLDSISDKSNYPYSAWYNDPTSFDNEEVTNRIKISFDKGILPDDLKNALKSSNPSETALKYATFAQNHFTINADGVPVSKNLLLGVEGLGDFNRKLAAVNSAMTFGITSPIPELKDMDSEELVKGTGKFLTSLTEGMNNINMFYTQNPNQPLGVKLNNQARILGFGKGDEDNAYKIFKKTINDKLFNKSPVLLAGFQNIGDYMLMVGTKIDEAGLKQMIDDYVEINTRKDGIVFDTFNSQPSESIFGLDLVFKSPEMSYAFTNSVELMVNQSFFDAALESKMTAEQYREEIPAYYFEHNPDNLSLEEINEIFGQNRVDWSNNNPSILTDDRVIARNIIKGGQETITKKYSNGNIITLTGTVFPIPGFYKKEVPEETIYDDKKSFENILKNKQLVDKDAKKLFLIPLPYSRGRDINAPESVFDLEYIVAVQSSGGGLKPLINPTNGVTFTVNPKSFKEAVNSYNEIKKLVSLNEAEKKAYLVNQQNADNPEWQKKVGPLKQISDKTIRHGIEIFNILNKKMHGTTPYGEILMNLD